MYIPSFIDKYLLEDEISLLQYGQTEEIDFESIRLEAPEPSYFKEFPTKENPTKFYKFNGLWLELGQSVYKVERQTYSLLDWLGDVGGLFDGLLIIFSSIMGSLASLSLKSKILALVFT